MTKTFQFLFCLKTKFWSKNANFSAWEEERIMSVSSNFLCEDPHGADPLPRPHASTWAWHLSALCAHNKWITPTSWVKPKNVLLVGIVVRFQWWKVMQSSRLSEFVWLGSLLTCVMNLWSAMQVTELCTNSIWTYLELFSIKLSK